MPLSPRLRTPAPLETCGGRSPTTTRFSGKADGGGPRRRRRTRTARCTRSSTGLAPSTKIRVISPDVRGRVFGQQGPGLSRLRLRDRRLDHLRGAPVKWMEDPLGEPDVDPGFARRLRDARADRPRTNGMGKIPRRVLQSTVNPPTHGPRFQRERAAGRAATTRPAFFKRLHTGSYDVEAAHLPG